MRLSVVKAEDIIGDIASRLEPQVAAAFRQAVAELRQQLPTGFIRDLLEAGDYGQLRRVLAEIRWSIDSFPGLRQALRDTATQAAAQATIDLDIDFNLINPYAVQWADQHAAELVTSVSDETRAALARITSRAQSEGLTVQAQTRLIESVVGLTEQHAVAVANHMQGLMDDGFSEREAIRMSQTMRDRLLRWRATNIARTETIKAANMGTQIGWQQAQAQGRLTTLAKVWIVSPDERLCPQCAVLEGNIVSVDSNFVATTEATGFNIDSQTGEDRITIAGERVLDEPFTDLTPPRHPQCRCTIGLTESEQTVTPTPMTSEQLDQLFDNPPATPTPMTSQQLGQLFDDGTPAPIVDTPAPAPTAPTAPTAPSKFPTVTIADDPAVARDTVKDLLRDLTPEQYFAASDDRADGLLEYIYGQRGFNGLPEILDDADFDALESEVIWRGVPRPEHRSNFTDAPIHRGGEGIYGNGTYAANDSGAFTDGRSWTGREVAQWYSEQGATEQVPLLEMKMSPDANLVDFDDLIEATYDGFRDELNNQDEVPYARYLDPGPLAAAMGYDGIRVKRTEVNYTVILNRSKVKVRRLK